MSKKISIVIPVFNEEEVLDDFWSRLSLVLKEIENYNFEIIFVDDGSTDGSFKKLKKISEKNKQVICIRFSRNFGKERALAAGLAESTGEAVLTLDADLQHPPSLISKFIEKWEEGVEVVAGARRLVPRGGFLKRAGSFVFYRFLAFFGEADVPAEESDYRLLDRKVVDAFNGLSEKARITRGLINWLGFEKEKIFFEVEKRKKGCSKQNPARLARLFVSAVLSHSLFPLKLAGYLGGGITLLAGVLGVFMLAEDILLGDPWRLNFSGTAFLAVLILFLVGIVLFCLGLTALYIASIHQEVKRRPLYVIKEKVGLSEDEKKD